MMHFNGTCYAPESCGCRRVGLQGSETMEYMMLLGGHSYGGAVALEIAMVLESWGHDIGVVVVCTLLLLLCCWC